MTTTNIDDLIKVLRKAKEQGCSKVKLQLYDSWEQVLKERITPSRPARDYSFDVRYYNSVEFSQEIKADQATGKLLVQTEKDLLILRVEISDIETLMRGFGLEEE